MTRSAWDVPGIVEALKATIISALIGFAGTYHLDEGAQRRGQALEIACSFATCALRLDITAADVRQALALTERPDQRRPVGFVPRLDGNMR